MMHRVPQNKIDQANEIKRQTAEFLANGGVIKELPYGVPKNDKRMDKIRKSIYEAMEKNNITSSQQTEKISKIIDQFKEGSILKCSNTRLRDMLNIVADRLGCNGSLLYQRNTSWRRMIEKNRIGEVLEHESDIDWVIVGGESGAKARPMKRDWAEHIFETCERQDIPVWFKQWGGTGRDKGGNYWNGELLQERPYGK